MIQQFIGVGNILDIQQLHQRVALSIEMLVHILQHGLDAVLLAIADRPHAVKLKSLAHGTLEDENGRSARAADEVGPLGIQMGNRLGEDRMVPAVEQADAVGTNQGTAILLAGVEDALLEEGALVGLLAEAGRYNNERANVFLLGQILYLVRTELGSHHQDGQVRGRQFLGIVEGLNALHLVLFGIHNTQGAIITTTQQITHHGTAWFMYIIRAANDDNALWLQKLLVNHRYQVF